MVKKRSRTKRSSKKMLIICAVFLALLALGIGRYMYEQSVVSEMRSIADEMRLDSSWSQDILDTHMPPAVICLADEPCPHFVRYFVSQETISMKESDLDTILHQAQWPVSERGYCISSDKDYLLSCTKISSRKGYTIKATFDYKASGKNASTIRVDISR
jgi:hypothetical protein